MKILNLSALTLCSLLLFAAPAMADFIGSYDVGNWTQTLDGGSINLAGAPSSLTMKSSNSNNGVSNQDFTISAVGSGSVSFDWDFSTVDWNPYYDPFGYLLNGVFTKLSNDSGPNSQSGSTAFTVGYGDVFGFRAHSVDSIYGSATITVSNFNGPGPAAIANPEPTTVVLLGSGLVGLVAWRGRKATKR